MELFSNERMMVVDVKGKGSLIQVGRRRSEEPYKGRTEYFSQGWYRRQEWDEDAGWLQYNRSVYKRLVKWSMGLHQS